MIGGAAVAWSLAARAQQDRQIVRIGTLDFGTSAGRQHLWDAFHQSLRDLGYVEGQNIAFETRWADGITERIAALASELVARKVDVIVTASGTAARAAVNATRTIPIVMATGPDAVGSGLVQGLSRPGGNVTGITTLSRELGPLRLQMLRSAVPSMSGVALLADLGSGTDLIEDVRRAAQALGVSVEIVKVRTANEFADAFSQFVAGRADGLVLAPSAILFSERRRVAELALKSRLLMVAISREEVEAGALLSYGPNLAAGFRRAAGFVILS
jgi:putative ABC transport system substrate-binding protein